MKALFGSAFDKLGHIKASLKKSVICNHLHKQAFTTTKSPKEHVTYLCLITLKWSHIQFDTPDLSWLLSVNKAISIESKVDVTKSQVAAKNQKLQPNIHVRNKLESANKRMTIV